MLLNLDIRGLAIIDTLSIEFDGGFNVITGETGAGKSILIKALSLLLGGKVSAEAVRSGVTQATVTGTFDIPRGHPSRDLIEARDLPSDGDDDAVLVRRSISAKGRSKAWINDVPVTIGMLRELGSALIDVFGQHENQRLLDPTQHTTYVDQFLESRDTLELVCRRFEECNDRQRELARMAEDFRARRRDADYITYRAGELDSFDPTGDDYEAVRAICESVGGEARSREVLAEAQAILDGGIDGEPLSQPVWVVSRTIGSIAGDGDALRELADDAADVAARLDDLSFRVGQSASSHQVDEAELQAAQDRLAGYQDLLRKFAARDIDALLEERRRLASELEFLESAAVEARELAQDLRDRARTLKAAAKKLTTARKKASGRLVERIEEELHELAMPGASLAVEWVAVDRSLPDLDLALFGDETVELWQEASGVLATVADSGAEAARLMLASNAGEPAHALHKIASGGEVSRIMLALKKGLAAGADTCILVFDEIDAGISGRVADVVGRKMRELGQDFQVICISHLAQVAAYADSHFQVEKARKGKRTETDIRRLSAKEAEEAVARLLSGREVSRSSLANARALIAKATE